MQLSTLEPRLAVSLTVSLLLLAPCSLLSSPSVAEAAQLALDSVDPLAVPNVASNMMPGVLYEPEFSLFHPSIMGRAPPGVATLENNVPKTLNLQPGSTACYMVEKSVIFPGGSTKASSQSLGLPRPKTLHLSANTCLQPAYAASTAKKLSPPQLILSVSNSSKTACKTPPNAPKDNEGRAFQEGAVMYSLNATGDVYVGITAPNVSSDFKGLYNVEVAASLDDYFHRYENRGAAELLWMDSDSTSALLVTRNLTEKEADIPRIMSQDPPYELFVSNKYSTAMDGLRHSVCGLQNTALMRANSLSNRNLNSLARTSMTLRGPGNFPKQQFYFVELNESSSYTGILVKKSNLAGGPQKRQDGSAGSGSVVFQGTEFQTVSGTNCKVTTDLEFCNETQYAVPGNDKKFNSTSLAKAYDDYAKMMYSNFEKVIMQIPCEAPKTSLYSLARNCDDCKAANKKWLCTVSMPRCEDFGSSNPFALERNAAQAFPNGTRLADDVAKALQDKPYSMASRNRFVDEEIQPGPYKEILPCQDICYGVVQSCPASMGFTCPEPQMASFKFSYGQRGRNGSTVACNYPGEARTPMSAARELSPDVTMLGGLSLVAALMLG